MSEAIIVKRGSSNSDKIMVYTREIITNNIRWTMPSNIINNEIYVELIGGGGGAFRYYFRQGNEYNRWYSAHGGGGYFNNGNITLSAGESVQIRIGSNGSYHMAGAPSGGSGNSGGTTSFGTYLSSNGGLAGNQILNGGIIELCGGSGGSGGGVEFRNCNLHNYVYDNGKMEFFKLIGGTGYQFGGGGVYVNNNASGNFTILSIKGGNGGPWGGGGGIHSLVCDDQIYGVGGANGGNGGTLSISAENGTNTRRNNMENFGVVLNGYGRRGNNGGGGGGYGGNGGHYGGGGGGYGFYGVGSGNGGGGSGYGDGGWSGGGGGIRLSNIMTNFGAGGSWSNSTAANGKSGVCVIYYYRWLSNGEQIGT